MCASSYSLTFVTISDFLSMVSIPFPFNLSLQVIATSSIDVMSATTEATSSSLASQVLILWISPDNILIPHPSKTAYNLSSG